MLIITCGSGRAGPCRSLVWLGTLSGGLDLGCAIVDLDAGRVALQRGGSGRGPHYVTTNLAGHAVVERCPALSIVVVSERISPGRHADLVDDGCPEWATVVYAARSEKVRGSIPLSSTYVQVRPCFWSDLRVVWSPVSHH